ncbi:MAG: hypothetical protein L0216_21385 [Planctomycetales bacterium]|nr:hypothetical protein [Planctomycetales bacterium]
MSRHIIGAVLICGLLVGDSPAGAQEKKGWRDRASEAVRGAGEKARGAMDRAGDRAREGLDRAKERTRESIDRAKEKVKEEWQERAHTCPSCGRTIHIGSTCAACATKRVTDRAREEIQKREHPCSVCGRSIVLGSRCAGCATKLTIERVSRDWKARAHPCSSCGAQIHAGSRCGRCAWGPMRTRLAERTARLRPRVEAVTREYGPRVRQFVTDPENQRRAIEALAVGYALYREQDTVKRQLTEAAILKLGNGIVVTTPKYGRVTLLDLSTRALVERAPYLRGTDIEKDPAKVLTHLIYQDTDYFLTEAKLVVRNGEPLSVTEALAKSNPALAQDALVCLEAMDAYETLTDEMLTVGDVQLAARGLEVALTPLQGGGGR